MGFSLVTTFTKSVIGDLYGNEKTENIEKPQFAIALNNGVRTPGISISLFRILRSRSMMIEPTLTTVPAMYLAPSRTATRA